MKNLTVPFLLTFSSVVYAFDDVPLEAHVHGLVEMNLVAEADHIEVLITSPLMNLVGFEYAPKNDAEKAAIRTMVTTFSTPQAWLQFNGRICQLTHHSVSHSDEHNHHHHDKHESQHAELEANYRFECESGHLNSVTVSLQESFPAIDSINLIWIVGTHSGIATLHHDDNTVHFSH